ncbi:MAG: hypothetical protein EZS28_003608 [Streblomastix strix]|uniref:non-specific serine/threonine protein kinase n=1 Tax=Streblomastix strix TaxID=222440 RepID=A0A5J4X0T1_9EUKA|nr:MAG: hypothetical protein EZS28_003608 [Streblomastix strix]
MKKVDYLRQKDKTRADAEVEQMRRLASPFIIRLLCSFQHNVELCLIMEYCEKGDLRKVIFDIQNLPEEERVMCVWAIFGQMARALDNLHSKCVIHRDIKPENIFMMADGSVRLIYQAMIERIKRNDHEESPSWIPQQIKQLILNMLSPDYEKRATTKIKFFAFTYAHDSTFTITHFKSCNVSSIKGVEGSRHLEWGNHGIDNYRGRSC